MRVFEKHAIRVLNIVFTTVLVNIVALWNLLDANVAVKIFVTVVTGAYVLGMQVIPSFYQQHRVKKRHRICGNGCELLLVFIYSVTFSVAFLLYGILSNRGKGYFLGSRGNLIAYIVVGVLVEALIFWNGIIRVYVTSVQLGIRYRVIGILCGLIPIANIVALIIIIYIAMKEVDFENEKVLLNQSRESEQICQTKYPILMVHGVFFRDFLLFNYWGRIPEELKLNGASVFYGEHQSALSVEESAKELLVRIKQVCAENHCEKVNIIAHSKGGLDCRYAIEQLGAGEYVASLTTINTPHRGCEFADYLMEKIPKTDQMKIAKAYNTALKRIGDDNPDFMAAVTDLTASACQRINELPFDSHVYDNVFCQSYGSKLTVPGGGRFPLNFSNRFVERFDGANDGLVGEKSFSWSENYQFLTVKGKRGISHGDMIDLNRENFDEFDVREFFVQLVKDLKERNL